MMIDPFIVRPLLFALVEFGLAALVYKKGVTKRQTVALLLFFLGGYQLGEFLFLWSDNQFWVQVAAASTTMLPPLGIKILATRKWEKYAYWGLQAAAVLFAISFLLFPGIVEGATREFCLVKYSNLVRENLFVSTWAMYYLFGLLLGVTLAGLKAFTASSRKLRQFYLAVLATYLSFLPTSYLLITANGQDGTYLPSTMCALAIFAAFIMTWASLKLRIK